MGPPSIPAGRWMFARASASSPHFPSHQEGKGSPRWFPASLPAPSWPSLLFAISILFSASPLSLLTRLVSEPIFPAPPSSGVPIPEWADSTDRCAFASPFLTAWTTCYTLHTGSEGEAEEACQGRGGGKGWRRGPPVGVCGWSPWRRAPWEVTGEADGIHIRREPLPRLGLHLEPVSLSRGLLGASPCPFPLNRQPVESWWRIRERG